MINEFYVFYTDCTSVNDYKDIDTLLTHPINT